jgi:hypothetical protein
VVQVTCCACEAPWHVCMIVPDLEKSGGKFGGMPRFVEGSDPI